MKRLKNHNRLMVLGTAAADENGEPYLSPQAKRRCDRAAEAFFASGFKREEGSVLIAGGYGKELFQAPPLRREARLMADYLMGQYPIQANVILIEDESTTTEENFTFSLQAYPEFYEDVMNDGERKLGLVSDPDHLGRAMRIGGRVLDCYERHFKLLPTWDAPYQNGIVVPRHTAKITPIRPSEPESYLAATGDQ